MEAREVSMLHVKFTKWLCFLSLISHAPCHFQDVPMSHVEFKKYAFSCPELLFHFAKVYVACRFKEMAISLC